jgi:hypothetical protein
VLGRPSFSSGVGIAARYRNQDIVGTEESRQGCRISGLLTHTDGVLDQEVNVAGLQQGSQQS